MGNVGNMFRHMFRYKVRPVNQEHASVGHTRNMFSRQGQKDAVGDDQHSSGLGTEYARGALRPGERYEYVHGAGGSLRDGIYKDVL